ncbi:hypothetical protein ABT076_10775 [Streptomyces sp. NPDC002131]|uniref:hypothetical protein n=1 Tax=Streptomyces sp. NPDC002131 TaxID=3154535 RepID=UPI003323DFEE
MDFTTPIATVRPTRYTVSVLPEGDINHHIYEVTVEDRGADRWAVCWMGECLAADGSWNYEPRPSSRDDDWLDNHRFTLGTALQLAEQAAPNVLVNGITAGQALARHEESAS